MKITEYIPFIKEQFQVISNEYDMSWSEDENEYQMILQNDTTLIRFATFYREEGINITLRNKDKDEFYYVWDLEQAKGYDVTLRYLTQANKKKYKSFQDNIKEVIYI